MLLVLLGGWNASELQAGPEAPSAPAAPCERGGAAAAVWQPGVTKGYYFRRYVDPAQPRLLHGGHVVWRREDDGGWILTPAREVVETGPAAGARRVRSRPAPRTAELAAELARQRVATAEVTAGAARFKEAQAALTREPAEVGRLARELKARLPGQSETEVRERAALQAELRRLGERLERLEKAAPPQPIAPPKEAATPTQAPARR
ncbi:MAG: hypothetical protein JSR82_00165 [Verrucomicrobia bacterium]|nr:hypothetical protein [Verrucomicrobiota bacterium]